MKHIFIVLFCALALMVFLTGKMSYAGEKTQDVEIQQVDVDELKDILEANKGKVVLVNFWAIWCGYCVDEIPALISLYDKYKDRGLEIIGVSLDGNGMKRLPGFIKKMHINYPIYLSSGVVSKKYEISKEYKIYGIPLSILYNRDGKQVERIPGARSEDSFEEKILKVLNK